MKVLYLSFAIVLLDQISKLFVKGFSIPFLGIESPGMNHGQKITVIEDVLNITFIENPGMAFGIDLGPDYKMLITIVTIIASLGLLIYLFIIHHRLFSLKLSVAIILGGALGNLIDRTFYGLLYDYAPLLHGKVVDFINIRVFNFHFINSILGNYIFNVADLAVTTGVILLLIAFNKERKENPELQPSFKTYSVEPETIQKE